MVDNRPSVYLEDGVAIYRASALGHQCPTQLVAARLGYSPAPVPAWLQTRYDEGTEAEPIIIERLRRELGWEVTGDGDDNQLELEIPVGASAKIRLHPDGLARIPDQKVSDFVLEVKAFGDDYWERFVREGVEGFPGYAVQTSLEMAATGRPCLFVVAHKPGRMEDKTLNPDEYWECEYTIRAIEKPLVAIGDIKKKVIAVEMAAKRGEIPKCAGVSFPCAYPQLHEDETAGGEDDVTPDPILDAAAAYLDECRRTKKAWEDNERAARERVMEVLAGRGEVRTERFEVRLGSSERATFDKKSFEASYPDLAKRFTKKAPVERLDVKATTKTTRTTGR